MDEDSDLLRQIWSAQIPVCFQLTQNEIEGYEQPDPFYAMVSRVSYLPLVMDKVIRHFDRPSRDLWLDFDGLPLKWHYPIGVLFDCLARDSLPWQLNVHFKDFPEDQLVRCGSRAAIESLFMSALKEADALKHRSQVMSQLQKKDHLQLWTGVTSDKFDQFWAVNKKLMDCQDFRFIPFRVYSQDLIQTQKLMKVNKENGENNTFGDLCSLMQEEEDEEQETQWITHGIEVPKETPLLWMSQHLSYADNFLHICALKKS